MATVCVSTITPIDIPNKKVKVSADITVDLEPTITVVMEKADISTPQNKALVAGTIWDKFIVKRNKYLAEQGITQEITDLQDALNVNIAARTP